MTRRYVLWALVGVLTLAAAAPAVASKVCDEGSSRRDAAGDRDRAIRWQGAHLSQDGRTLLITVQSSILRLTKVVLRERARSVTVTVFQRRPPDGVSAPDSAVFRCVRVRLRAPLGERRLVDGRARRKRRVARDRYTTPADGPRCRRVRTVRQ